VAAYERRKGNGERAVIVGVDGEKKREREEIRSSQSERELASHHPVFTLRSIFHLVIFEFSLSSHLPG
jgi:hypothetical protein